MNSGYQGYGGGGYYGQSGGGAPQQQQQVPMYSNQFGRPPQQGQQQQQQQPGNMQQWQYPQQSQQGNGYGQSQPNQGGGFGQQPQQQGVGFGQPQQPGFFGFNDPALTNAAMGAITSVALGQGVPSNISDVGEKFFTSNFIPGFHSFMMTLRSYFAVDNAYVLQKMKKILFPFISQRWMRSTKQTAGPNPSLGIQYDLPVNDENAPDLYIPCMSLITYVLLCALCYGTAGKFNPEVIPDVCTKCFLTQILEVLAIRLGFYLMQTEVALLDLWSYTGYKYLGLCINLLIGILGRMFSLGGTTAYYVCFLWTASAASFLMLKIMSHTVPRETSAAGPKRELMILGFALSQFVTMWFVSQTKFL